MKRALSSLLVFALVLTLLVPAFAFAADKTTEQKFNELKEKGLLNGVEDGSAALDRELTRAELAAILVRLFKLEPITGQSSFIDVPENHWAQKEGVIEAVAKAGLMGSTTTYSKTFSPDAKLTIAEVATVTVRALKLTVDENAKIDGVQAWAAPYVDAALKAQVIAEAKDYHANATRGILVDAAYVIYNTILVPPVTDATKVESVSADNLAEVVVKFDGVVDSTTASDVDNYTIVGPSNETFTILSAAVAEDGKSVTLSIDATAVTHLQNQKAHKLSFSNIKAGDKVLSVKNLSFTPVDASLPSVVKVEALGNKTIKATFSEPVLNPTTASFLVDGKTVLGYPNTVGRVVTLRLYSPLSNGEHKVTVKDVQDFSGLKSLSQELPFGVVEDVTAPTIAEVVKTTFEYVTLKFSEPVDPTTINGANVYWLQGTTKKTAAYNATAIADDTYTFDFSNNLIQYPVDLYVTGIKDYSGNEIAKDTKVLVTPTVDTSRPEVVNAELDSLKQITIKFNKKLDPSTVNNKSENFVIKNSDGNEVSKIKTPQLQADGKTVVVTLVTALDEGETYTLTVQGVADATILKNVMLPYTKTISTEDETNPTVEGVYINTTNNTVVVTFSEQMRVNDEGSIAESGKYFYQASSAWKPLPSGHLITVTPDGTSAIIAFPSNVAVNTITDFRVQLVKDLAGNDLEGLMFDAVANGALHAATQPSVQSVTGKTATTINVKFDRPILANTVNANDFVVTAGTERLNVIGAALHSSDSTVVVLTLASNTKLTAEGKYTVNSIDQAVKVTISANATTSTADGMTIKNGVAGTEFVKDGIKPSVIDVVGSTDGKSIIVKFNEPLAAASGATLDNIASDFVIKKGATTYVPGVDYEVEEISANDRQLVITFTDYQTGVLSVAMDSPRFLKDAATPTANVAAALSATEVAVDITAPTATTGTNDDTTLELEFDEYLYVNGQALVDGADVKNYFVYSGTAANFVSATYDLDTKTITLVFAPGAEAGKTVKAKSVFTDKAGNVYLPVTYTFNGTTNAWE